MINIPPIKPRTEISTERLPDVTQTWKIGRVLNATVERGGEALDKILLRIGQQQLETRTPISINTGDTVKLLVKALGDTPLLSIQTDADTSRIAASQLRSVIARQQDMTELLRLAQKLVNTERLSTPVKNQLREFIQQLPRSDQLSLPGELKIEPLKNALRNNGVFLESHLLRQPERVTADIKSALLQLSRSIQENDLPEPRVGGDRATRLDTAIKDYAQGQLTLRQLVSTLLTVLSRNELATLQEYLASKQPAIPAPLETRLTPIFQAVQQQPNARQLMENLFSLLRNLPAVHELKTAVDGSLARITSQQLMPLARDGDTPLLLQFDLPVKDRDDIHLFRFSIEEESASADDSHRSWTVTINFDLQPLGPVQAKLHIIDNQVSTVFQAERETTARTIQSSIGLLEQGFARAGLQPGKLDVISGRPPPPKQLADGVRHILDEQA